MELVSKLAEQRLVSCHLTDTKWVWINVDLGLNVISMFRVIQAYEPCSSSLTWVQQRWKVCAQGSMRYNNCKIHWRKKTYEQAKQRMHFLKQTRKMDSKRTTVGHTVWIYKKNVETLFHNSSICILFTDKILFDAQNAFILTLDKRRRKLRSIPPGNMRFYTSNRNLQHLLDALKFLSARHKPQSRSFVVVIVTSRVYLNLNLYGYSIPHIQSRPLAQWLWKKIIMQN